MNRQRIIVLAALLALPGYKCGNVIEDNGFDLWCGEKLCAWDLEEGQVARAPTWHSRDYGVEMVGERVVISQRIWRTSADLSCLRFELIADVAEGVSVNIELDFFDDGVIDHRQAIPTSSWAPLSYPVTMPDSYQGLRVRLVKQGSGRAVLADIAAIDTDDCTEPPLETASRPEGAWCESDDECDTGVCAPPAGGLAVAEGVCAQCAEDADCPDGQVCGAVLEAPPHLDLYRTCVPAKAHALGEPCAGDGECATGVCSLGVCSTCSGTYCSNDRACEPRPPAADVDWPAAPRQCSPRAGLGEPGEACLGDDDCASGECAGGSELRLCLWDGRACTDDADCPPNPDGLLGGYARCEPAGIEGGVCQ